MPPGLPLYLPSSSSSSSICWSKVNSCIDGRMAVDGWSTRYFAPIPLCRATGRSHKYIWCLECLFASKRTSLSQIQHFESLRWILCEARPAFLWTHRLLETLFDWSGSYRMKIRGTTYTVSNETFFVAGCSKSIQFSFDVVLKKPLSYRVSSETNSCRRNLQRHVKAW